MENQSPTPAQSAHDNTQMKPVDTSKNTQNTASSPTNAKKNKNKTKKNNNNKSKTAGSPETNHANPSQPVELPTTNQDTNPTNDQEELPLRTQIMRQLEYYFSDENLSRDKFLTKEMEKDETQQGYISLDLLATFPRMQRLTNNVEEIRAAVRESKILKLSKSGQKARRVINFESSSSLTEEQQMEQRTIYVSYLPKNSDRNSVRGIFGICGNIRRVDLPIDKKTGEIKGIAFVEFEDKQQAKKALKYFSEKSNDFFKLGMRVRAYSLKPPANAENSPQSPHFYPLQHHGASPQSSSSSPQSASSPSSSSSGGFVTGSLSPPIPIASHYHHNQQHIYQQQQQQQQQFIVPPTGSSPQHHQINAVSSSPSKQQQQQQQFASIYEQAPTFNYSKDKRKKRSGSKPEPPQPDVVHNGNNGGNNNNNNSNSNERPKLQLRPRSESIGSSGRLTGLGGLGTPGSIVPLRQPFPPDGTRGFSAGRGKPLST